MDLNPGAGAGSADAGADIPASGQAPDIGAPEVTAEKPTKSTTLKPIKSLPFQTARDSKGRFIGEGEDAGVRAPWIEKAVDIPDFLKDKSQEGQKVEAAPQIVEEAPKAPAPVPQKFKLGDLEFDSEEQAAQNLKSLRGTFKSMQAREQAAQQEAQRALDIAKQYQQQLEQAQRQAQAPPQQLSQAQQQAQPTKAEVVESFTKSYDWATHAQIAKTYGQDAANQLLLEDFEKAQLGRVESLMAEKMAPFTQYVENAQLTQKTVDVFESVAGLQNHDGSPAYPELANDQDAEGVGYLWQQLNMPENLAYSPQGLYLAILAYRDYKARASVSATPVQPISPEASAAASRIVQSMEGAANAGPNGVVRSTPSPTVQPVMTESQRIKRDIFSGSKQAENGGLFPR